MINKIDIPTRREWYLCPHCGRKLVIYDDTAVCIGVYVKCRECRREVKIEIKR